MDSKLLAPYQTRLKLDSSLHLDSPLHKVSAVFLAFTLSYLAAKVSGLLVLRPQMIWPLWLGCALLVAILLLTARRNWPLLLLAGLAGFTLFNVQEGLTVRSIVSLLVADSVEILIAALGVNYVFHGVPELNSVRSLAKYCFFSVIVAPIFVCSFVVHALKGDSWWIGLLTEALALLIVTPAMLGLVDFARRRVKKPKVHYLEAASMFLGLSILGYVIFMAPGGEGRPALLYSLVPFLLWAALRFGITGTTNSLVLVALIGTLGVVNGHGPFSGDTPLKDVISLQIFLLVIASSFMVLAAVVEEHDAAEQTVRKSEERLRLAQQGAVMGTFEWNMRTGVNTWTAELEAIYGLPPGGFAGTQAAFENLVHPDDRAAVIELVAISVRTGKPASAEWRVLWPNGSVHWMGGRWQVFFDESGEPLRTIGVNIDITERKQAEESLRAMSGKLIEAQEQARVRIGRELHDDINQRLAMLAVELQQLQENPSEVQNRVQQLRKQTQEISADVQALSHELHSSKLEYLGVVRGIRSWCTEFAERSQLEIAFKDEVFSLLPLEVGICLFRVLQEALHNAVKHSGVKRVEVEIAEYSNAIHLAILDSGKGFDVETARDGRGLGLTSMQERVKLLNGTITIQSRPKGGTSIQVRIPLRSEQGYEQAVG
jgi:PAS domain S-box-containing protein